MRRGHITLNGLPYLLATDDDGRIVGANVSQLTGPWATQISQGDRQYQDMHVNNVAVWESLTGGAGQYKGQDLGMYRRGNCDTRSGDVILPAAVHGSLAYLSDCLPSDFEGDMPFAWFSVGVGGDAYVEGDPFYLGSSAQVQTLGVMVRRVPTVDYSGGWPFQVQLYKLSLPVLTATVEPLVDIPRLGWYWLPATAATVETLTTGTYTIRVTNASGPIVHVGQVYDGYTTHVYYKLGRFDYVDGPVRDLVAFTGGDGQERLFAAVNRKVMYYDTEGQWSVAGNFGGDPAVKRVQDLEVFAQTYTTTTATVSYPDGALWVAVGASVPIWTFTGGSAGGVWQQRSTGGAQVLAVHDALLWRAEGNEVSGSFDGITWGTAVKVGHLGEPVIDMVSQEGHLFARTKSGIFQVDYDTPYPHVGAPDPVATRVVNLHTDPSPHEKPCITAWGAGVLFPLWYDLAQYQAGLITPIGIGRGQALNEADRRNVYGLHATNRGVYAALSQEDGYGEVMVYQQLAYEGGGAGWHSMFRHPVRMEEVEAVYLAPEGDGDGAGRLWFGAGWNVQSITVPLWTAGRHLWTGADYQPSGFVEYTPFDAGKGALVKDWIKVKARVQNATAARPVTYLYQLGDPQVTAGAWATLGQVATSGITELTFGSLTYSYNITLRAELETDDETETPQTEATELWYQDVLPPLQPFHLSLMIGDEVQQRSGLKDDRSVAEQWADLEALADEMEGFVFVDELEQSYTVRVTQMRRTMITFTERSKSVPTPEYRVQLDLLRI